MRILCVTMVWLLAGLVFGGAGGDVRLAKPPDLNAPDERLYVAALRGFKGGHWATAARLFRELIDRHQDSARKPEAVLLLVQSLYMQGVGADDNAQFAEAIQVLTKNPMVEGVVADDHLFWEAECLAKLGNLNAASQKYQELLNKFPESERAVEAIVALANVAGGAGDWVKVVEHLQPAEGIFQKQAADSPNDEAVLEGRLLLARALLEQNDLTTVATVLDLLPKMLAPGRDWRRRFLRARMAVAGGKDEEAEHLGDQLRAQAEQQNSMNQLVAAYQFRAQLYANQSNWDRAAREWSHLMKEGLPVAVRRYAYLNAAYAWIKDGDLAGASRTLQELLARAEFKPDQSLANCLLGEIRLEQHREQLPGHLAPATQHFLKITENENDPSLKARAQWGLAQCRLAENDAVAARAALQKGLEVVTDAKLRARIQYQLALGWSQGGSVVEARAGFRNVRTNAVSGIPADLLNAARYMQFKNTLAEDPGAAEALLAEMRTQAGASHLDQALLALAQFRVDQGEIEAAKAVLVEFRRQAPGSSLQAEAALEAVRLLVLEGKWAGALEGYKNWIEKYPNHPDRLQVLFDRAWATAQAGDGKTAGVHFAQLSTNRLTAPPVFMARMWLADRAYNSRTNQVTAERLYKEIRSATNCPPMLRHRAGMMAGRAAMERQGYAEARAMFGSLIDDAQVKTNSPSIHVKASFALGDLTMLELGSGVQFQIKKLSQSTNAFDRLINPKPNDRLQPPAIVARAWGRIGDCCLMVSGDQPDYHQHALAAYRKSLAVAGPVPVEVRNHAYVGLAQALERQVPAGGDRTKLLQEAVDHLLAVYSGRHLREGEKLNRFWRRQSGLIALRLLTQLGRFDQALTICAELKKGFPGMRAGLGVREKQIEKLRANQP